MAKEKYNHGTRIIQRVSSKSYSLIVGIPITLVQDKGLKEGDQMEFISNGGRDITIRKKE